MCAAPASHRCSRFATLIVLFPMAFASAGCASSDTSRASTSRSASPGAVTGEELRQVPASNAYEALERLRPIWILPRPRSSLAFSFSGSPVVYLSGVPHGAASTLRGIEINEVLLIDFMTAIDAGIRYGTGHSGGIIWVELRW